MTHERIEALRRLLTSVRNVAFLTDTEARVQWCNRPEGERLLKDGLMLMLNEPLDLPLSCELSRPVLYEGSARILRMVPITDEDGNTEGYWGELLDDRMYDDLHRRSLERAFSLTPLFRQSVSSIINLAHSLMLALDSADMVDQKELARLQINNCYRMLRAITNWDEAQRYQYGEYAPRLVNVTRLFADICGACAGMIRGEGQSFRYSVPKEPVYTTLDPDRFLIALMNLLSNSLEYAFAAVEVELLMEIHGSDLVITVSDNGHGLSPQVFVQARDTGFVRDKISPHYERFGLGLFLADSFVRMAGGSILLTGKQNEGTVITMRLPITEDRDAPPYLESQTSDYLTNRFSPLYIYLADVCNLKLY